MPPPKSSFLDKVLGRIGRLDAEGLQTVVQRLARERTFLETLFNTIEDGVLVVDEGGRILYFNQAVTALLGLQPGLAEGQSISRFLPAGVTLLHQGNVVAEKLKDYLYRHPEMVERCSESGRRNYLTTESVSNFDQLANLFLGEEVQSQHVKLG